MPAVDFQLVEAQNGPVVSLLPPGPQFVRVDGTGEVYTGFGSLPRIDVAIRVDLITGDSDPTLTVLVEHSDDGEVWTTAATHEFTRDDMYRVVVSAPKDQLRASWTIGGGLLEAVISSVTVVPAFLQSSADGFTNRNAAPADGDLVAGQCMLWFDQTNGAAKLMVKAKQADGTVVTGELALAP